MTLSHVSIGKLEGTHPQPTTEILIISSNKMRLKKTWTIIKLHQHSQFVLKKVA